jgi:predicted GIY-YIG superfamily endonuclease
MKQTSSEAQTAASDIKWFVYLLRCGDGSLYTGITNDLTRRFNQHNAGTASRYTRSRLPVVLVYQEPQESQSHALKRELAIKALTRTQKEAMIVSAEQILQMPRSADQQ